MRASSGLRTVAEIVDRMLTAKGVTNARIDQLRGLQSAVLASLRHREGKGRVQNVAEGKPRSGGLGSASS